MSKRHSARGPFSCCFSPLPFVAGALCEVAFHSQSAIPMIGASGAIAGLMGAYLVLFPHVKVYVIVFFIRFRLSILWYLGFWATFHAVMAYLGTQGVAWMAHLGGFLTGSLIAYQYRREALSELFQPATLQGGSNESS